MMYLFQSTPGQLAGRCGAPNVRVFRSGSFNPRPANWPGDAQRIGGEKAFSILFQSTPGQLAGRCGWMYYIYLPKYSFNPRPANWPGDAYCRPSCQYTRLGFNPRPANWPGDAEQLLPIPGTTEVSIHARPIGRAMPAIAFKPVTTPMFQSTPGQLAGRCLPGLVQQPAPRRFNPRPANWPGDAPASVERPAPSRRFNPRPANWPGDAQRDRHRRQRQKVSIHARPIGRAMPTQAQFTRRLTEVSIHARPIGRAMRPGARG